MGKILAPDEEWINYIAQMWLLGNTISESHLNEKMDGSIADLGRLQSILDGAYIHAHETQKLQALGIVFGKVFVNETDGYDWWVMDDEYGKDACVRYKQTSLLTFPQSIILKRVENGEHVDVVDLYNGLYDQLERVRNENYAGA